MVKTIQKNDKTIYQCEECGLKYADEEIAEKCQVWCGEHTSCNLGIIKNAMKDSEEMG